ncbi:MAG: prephenate dehydratase [archaeon]
MKIAFQGEAGAYSEAAIFQHFGRVSAVPCKTFADVFGAVETGAVDLGVIPIENSHAGSITENYDLLLERGLFIVDEIYFRVVHCLLANQGAKLEGIKKVCSHPQALQQCRAFLSQHRFQQLATSDTAESARLIKKKGSANEAAIASELAAELYSLVILEKGIETDKENTTRFLVISKNKSSEHHKSSKTSVVFNTKDIPGALYNCLGCFANKGINLTKVESRPVRHRSWNYLFYLDFVGHIEDELVRGALDQLDKYTSFAKVLGSYPSRRNKYK